MKKNRPQRVDPNQPPQQNADLFFGTRTGHEVSPIRRQPNFLRIFLLAILILLVIVGISFLFLYINNSIFGKTNTTTATATATTTTSNTTASSLAVDSTSARATFNGNEAEKEDSSTTATGEEAGATQPRIGANEITIINPPRLSVEAAQAFARAKNAHPDFINLAPIFWRVAAEYQVDPLVVYCQSALETGFMHFNGVVSRDFCNPCGLKTTVGGGDGEQSAHMRFPDWESGIRAQVQHLALYAGGENMPLANPLDPRHFSYLKGTAPTVESLSQKWAPSEDYGQIIRQLMEEALQYAR